MLDAFFGSGPAVKARGSKESAYPARESEAKNGRVVPFLEGSGPSCGKKHMFYVLRIMSGKRRGPGTKSDERSRKRDIHNMRQKIPSGDTF